MFTLVLWSPFCWSSRRLRQTGISTAVFPNLWFSYDINIRLWRYGWYFLGCIWGEMAGEEEELKGSLPNELTVHISNTWAVKPTPHVILQKEKKKIPLFLRSVWKPFSSCALGCSVAVQETAAGMDHRMQRFASSLGNGSSQLHSTAGLKLPASSVWLGIRASTGLVLRTAADSQLPTSLLKPQSQSFWFNPIFVK